MDNTRLILYLSLGLVLFLLWGRWAEWNRPPPQPAVEQPAVPQAGTQAPPDADATAVQDDLPAAGKASESLATDAPQQQARRQQGGRVVVETDVLRVEIDARGGDLRSLEMLRVPVDVKHKDVPYRLLAAHNPRYTIQSGLLHDQTGGSSKQALANLAPSHYANYTINKAAVRLADTEDKVRTELSWRNETGIEVRKIYTFYRGSYLIDIDHHVRNRSGKTWIGRQYRQIRRQPPPEEGMQFIYTFTGGAYYDGKYNKISFSDMDEVPLALRTRSGWVAMLQHYFFSALLADSKADNDFYTRAVQADAGREYIIGMRSDAARAAPGDSLRFTTRIYAGPKLQNRIAEIAPGLDLVTDYGIFSVISKPLFWLLDWIYEMFGNWAVAIILLTVLIKLVFYKLSEASYKSMARMRKLQPSLLAMRERYKDDRQQLQKAMMEFYRKEKINPLGGCLPILVQIPVFIALYWVLLESVELRHAPFMLWIDDLSARDPYFVLPLLMGATMLVQMKLNPTPPDPLQAKVMMMMPIIFTGFFAFFPSGLVLYWLVNNILSIAQQWVINRRIERA